MSRTAVPVFLIVAALSATAARADEAPSKLSAAVKVEKTHLDFLVGKELAARYHFGPEVAKPYFWPVNAPGARTVTRGWPMEKAEPGEQTDHVHQKSAWFCHGDVIPEGLQLTEKIKNVDGVDFWSEAKGHGKMVCTTVGETGQKGNHAWAHTLNEWRTSDGAKILTEHRTIHLYALDAGHLFVVDTKLTARDHAVTFGDTKEGSFGVRVRDSMTEKKGKGKMTNAEGQVTEKNIWGQKSKWCDYSGPVPADGKEETAGIAVFDAPTNKYPACWHARGYGLMAANPFGRSKSGFPATKAETELVKLDKGQSLSLRYGMYAHKGDVKDGKVAEAFETFAKIKD